MSVIQMVLSSAAPSLPQGLAPLIFLSLGFLFGHELAFMAVFLADFQFCFNVPSHFICPRLQ